ncbi:CAAD domain-containing protein [Phormidium sp. CCY1219]|uniref:CAAD domain-containing protein n=1 Tax=Phormidium sp. CCY1219 TaxID=2886104 RepID=UPI002D1F3031|nr:CAAD domain-containing protein [Phormidium sp. CCY1219]MEB3830139.1 CAAD domain-containing protein [Phormidium sp. CCY1219]
MNPKTETSEPSNPKAEQLAQEAEQLRMDVKDEQAGALATVPPSERTSDRFQEITDRVMAVLAEMPAYVSGFFSDYQKPIVTLSLFLAALVTVRVTLAVVDAINDIPLLAPFFELVGMGYSAWFVYRYLLRASNRQELVRDISALKEQVIGKSSSEV